MSGPSMSYRRPELPADQRVLVLDDASTTLLADDVLREDGGRAVVWITHEPIGLDHVDTIVPLDHPRGDVTSA